MKNETLRGPIKILLWLELRHANTSFMMGANYC